MPLTNIVSHTATNTILPVVQCWLLGESEEHYVWAFNVLRLLMIEADVQVPRVFITDRDQACMKALTKVFPEVPVIVFRWHMDRFNVDSKIRQRVGQIPVPHLAPRQNGFENSPATNEFMALYHETIDSKTEKVLELSRVALCAQHTTLAAYLDLH